MYKLILKIFLLICVFLYIYSIKFKLMPISFTMLFGAIGVGVYFFKWILASKKSIFIDNSLRSIFLSMLGVICISVLSLVCNSTCEIYFIKLMITNSIAFAGAYTLSLFIKYLYDGEVRYDVLVKYITIAACIQVILALLLFFTPNSVDILQAVLAINELEVSTMDRLEGFRLMGFGVNFFDAGIIHALVLILIAIVMNEYKYSFWGTFGYTLAFILIGGIGMMMARTTVVGLVLALLYAIYKTKFWGLLISKKISDVFKTIFIIGGIIIVVIANLPPDILDLLEMTSTFGFEMFIKFFDSGKIETNSTDIMYDMFVYPDNIKTWLIGDGYFADPLVPELFYYKGTDIGFIRMLFYFGGLGLVVFYIYQLVVVYQVYKKNVSMGLLPFIIIYVLFIALNMKGMADLFPLLILFYFTTQFHNRQKLYI